MPYGTSFSISQVKLHVLANVGSPISAVNLYFFEDTGAGPGELITTMPLITPTTTVIGSAFGFDVVEVIVVLTEPVSFEAIVSDSFYWTGATITGGYNGTNSYLEGSIVINSQYEGYVYSEADGGWFTISGRFGTAPYDLVIEVSGECAALGVSGLIKDNVTLYP